MTARGDTTISRDELRHATLASVRWVTVVRVVAETIGLASTVVLARLLTPGEFGRAALLFAGALRHRSRGMRA